MVQAALGGVLAGIGAAVLYVGLGRIAGVGGSIHQVLFGDRSRWRVAFLAGILLAGAIAGWWSPPGHLETDLTAGGVAAAGLISGVGTRLANGCTSGHGLCGLGRLSPRSWVAATLFCVAGSLTTLAVRGVLG